MIQVAYTHIYNADRSESNVYKNENDVKSIVTCLSIVDVINIWMHFFLVKWQKLFLLAYPFLRACSIYLDMSW